VSDTAYTARFVCTTDRNLCQIASFYPGAMAESGRIGLRAVADRVGGLDLVLIGADDPATMLARADECRRLGLPFAADPSQQLARMSGAEVASFVDGARYLLTNEYERGLLEAKTGLTTTALLERVDVIVTTLGDRGVRIAGRDTPPIEVPAAVTGDVRDLTGVGDGFRAGFFAGVTRGIPLDCAAELGCVVAAHVIETVGTQEYTLDTLSLSA
jgi:adenosine kinase